MENPVGGISQPIQTGQTSTEKQVQALTLCLSHEMLTIVENLGLSDTQRGSVKEIVKVVALWELAKTCKFCFDACTQKNIRDQIIEGLIDGDTVESLLEVKDLTLETTIVKCRSLEAAKRQRAETSSALSKAVMTIRKAPTNQTLIKTCLGCGGNFHQGGQRQCPVYNLTCHLCQWIGHLVKVCRSRQPQPPTPHMLAHPATKAIFAAAPTEGHTPWISTTKLGNPEAIKSAPTICVHISSLNSKTEIEVLPDSGANLSLAGEATLTCLGEHKDNLLMSTIMPHAVNQTECNPWGNYQLQSRWGQPHTLTTSNLP